MDFNIVQILLVGVVGFIAGIDQFSFLESLYQPIVVGPIVGAILGNMELGLAVGGAYQLMAIGSMPIGGAQPPNAIIGGIMATTFAVSMNYTVDNFEAVLGLAVPFALLGQYAVTITFTVMSPLMTKADKYAADANPKGIVGLNYLAMGILGLLFAVISMVGVAAGSTLGATLTSIAEDWSWVMAGLSAAGGMMRYVGFAILLKVMMSNDLWGFFLAGFAFAAIFGNIPATAGATLVLVAFIGICIALFDYQMNVKIKNTGGAQGGMTDGI